MNTPKRSDDLCNYNGPERKHTEEFKGQFVVKNNKRFYRICVDAEYGFGTETFVPTELIDELREDEWDYDSSVRTLRKEFLTCA